jgi:hypothetical protein
MQEAGQFAIGAALIHRHNIPDFSSLVDSWKKYKRIPQVMKHGK